MPAWATVAITLGAGVIGVLGTLAGTWLQLRQANEQAEREATRARRARAAEILGPIRALLADVDPDRVVLNLSDTTTAELANIERRWKPLREKLLAFASNDEDSRVMAEASLLEMAVSNAINRVKWDVRGLLSNDPSPDAHAQAGLQQLRAAVRVRIILDLVRGRDIEDLEKALEDIDEKERLIAS
jgi:hypothetical protein